jgi:hypothetical protein
MAPMVALREQEGIADVLYIDEIQGIASRNVQPRSFWKEATYFSSRSAVLFVAAALVTYCC